MSPADKGSDKRDGVISEEDRAAFKRRSDEIGRKLEAVRQPRDGDAGKTKHGSGRNNEAMGRALRMSTELIGGIVVGSAIGWWLDTTAMPYLFGAKTWPLMFIIFFLLGSAAGMLNVVRSGLKMKTGPLDPKKGPAVRDDEDDH